MRSREPRIPLPSLPTEPCRNGHPRTPEHLRWDGRHWRCRTCDNESATRRERQSGHVGAYATAALGATTYPIRYVGRVTARPDAERTVIPEPDADPPPRLLLAGPWSPPRFDSKGRMLS